METLYHQTNSLVQLTQAAFPRLEKCNTEEIESLEREIQARIDTITSNCERLDLLVLKEPLNKRQTARSRVEQLKYDNQHLQAALRMLQHRRSRIQQESLERVELLNMRFRSTQDDENTTILIDHALQHNNSLQNANKNMDEIIFNGTSILHNLRDQRISLKGAQRRMMDVANTLGLSNTTMRIIENRVRQDKWILLGGMTITLLVIFVTVFYIKKIF